MARAKMVTRSIESTVAHLLGVNINDQQVITSVIEFAGHFDANKVLKFANDNEQDNAIKWVNVNSISYTETLYGMYENDFLKNAMRLDPVTRKPIA